MKNCIVFKKEQMQNHTAEQSILLNDTFTLWLVLVAIIIITEVFLLCLKSLVGEQDHQIRKKTFWFEAHLSGDLLLGDQQTIVNNCSLSKCFRNPEILACKTPQQPTVLSFPAAQTHCNSTDPHRIGKKKKKAFAPLGHGKQNEIPALQNDNANDCCHTFMLGRGTHWKKQNQKQL